MEEIQIISTLNYLNSSTRFLNQWNSHLNGLQNSLYISVLIRITKKNSENCLKNGK